MLAEVGQGKVLDGRSGLLAHIPRFPVIIPLVKEVSLGKMTLSSKT